jgi:predicted N-formylglutamate amidohydrolase
MPIATTHTTPEAPPFKLLADDEPEPVVAKRIDGASPFFLTCDHAGKIIPRSLGRLGVPESELGRHIAWDIGIAAVSERISDALDAALVMQIYSRLVIDCNRDPLVPSSICEISESTPVPGNMNLDPEDRRARQKEILEPYHARITSELDRRQEAGRPAILVAMHSFTPVFKEISRPWHVGVLHNRDTRLAEIMLDLFRREDGLVVGDNEPYFVSDLTDYGIPVHGEKRGLPHIELEIRQDLITEEKGQREWADRLIRLLPQAFRAFDSRAQKATERTSA